MASFFVILARPILTNDPLLAKVIDIKLFLQVIVKYRALLCFISLYTGAYIVQSFGHR